MNGVWMNYWNSLNIFIYFMKLKKNYKFLVLPPLSFSPVQLRLTTLLSHIINAKSKKILGASGFEPIRFQPGRISPSIHKSGQISDRVLLHSVPFYTHQE